MMKNELFFIFVIKKPGTNDERGCLVVERWTELRGVLVNPHHIVFLSKTHFPPKVHVHVEEAVAQSQHG